jgi:hypothetical protein
METFETYAPLFAGFYGTIYEYNNEDFDIESYNEENNTNLNYDDFEWDYSDYRERIAKRFVSEIESELNMYFPIKITYQNIQSPKYYNFTNDSINISVEVDLNKLIDLIKENNNEAEKYFLDNYTSRDGFTSFHSNDINDWINIKYILEDDKHRVGAIIDCLSSIFINIEDVNSYVLEETYINFKRKNKLS